MNHTRCHHAHHAVGVRIDDIPTMQTFGRGRCSRSPGKVGKTAEAGETRVCVRIPSHEVLRQYLDSGRRPLGCLNLAVQVLHVTPGPVGDSESEAAIVVSFGFSRFFCLFRPNRSFPSIDALLSICHFSSTKPPVALAVLVCQANRGISTTKRSSKAS